MFRTLRPYQLVVDVVLAAVFALVLVPVELSYPTPGASPVPGTAAALVFAVALAVRRLSPGLALVGAWFAAIVQMLFLLPPRPADAAIFAILYVTAAYGTRLVYWLGLASAVLGAVVITAYLFLAQDAFSVDQLTTAAAVLAAALFALLLSWVTGALVRTVLRAAATRRAQAVAEAATAAEQERVRIARDMHDVVAHSLAVVIAQADGARYAAASASPAPGSAATAAALATISSTARAALADVRLLLAQLRHGEGPGPQAQRPQPALADVEAVYAQVRATGVELQVDVDPAPPGEPPASVQLAVYRILQEALANALRHGGAGPVAVRMSWLPDRVELVVRNPVPDGASAAVPADASTTPGGHGLIGMRERAQLVGGRLDAGARGAEFVVAATLPVGVPAVGGSAVGAPAVGGAPAGGGSA